MNLVTPGFGLLFWMVVIFAVVLFILAKFGFPAITDMVEKRTGHISDSLELAARAEERIRNLAREQEAMLEKTRKEQTEMLRAAAQTRQQIIEQARQEARAEADKLMARAKTEIEAEKESAVRDIRREMALLSLKVAEKVVRKDLSEDAAQIGYINTLIDEFHDSREARQS